MDEQPSIVIYCKSMRLGEQPFTEDYYWQAYQDLLFALKDRGVAAYLASGDTYEGNGWFSEVYDFDHKTSLDKLKTKKQVHANLVFDRGNFSAHDVLVINHPHVARVMNSKLETYVGFARFQPYSVICTKWDEVEKAVAAMPGEMVVVKDPHSFGGGYDVFIGSKADVLKRAPRISPLLVQEFLDTSAGIPNGIQGVHDVRISVCGGEIIGHYVRQAKPGSYHSNVSQGGTMVFYDVDTVPAEIRTMVADIDAKFAAYPRYYAADFMHTTKGWKLVEMNPLLALLPVTDGPEAVKTLERLADYLRQVCVESRQLVAA